MIGLNRLIFLFYHCVLVNAFIPQCYKRITKSALLSDSKDFSAILSNLRMSMHPSEMIGDSDSDTPLLLPTEFLRSNDPVEENPTDVDISDILLPSPDLCPSEIPRLLMRSLQRNDSPSLNYGLTKLWNFSGEGIHKLYNDNLEDFITQSKALSEVAPSSFYGMALNGLGCTFLYHPLNRIGGSPNGSWIATQIMTGTNEQGFTRNFQWRLIKQRRPPDLNCWFVEGLTVSDQDGHFDIE